MNILQQHSQGQPMTYTVCVWNPAANDSAHQELPRHFNNQNWQRRLQLGSGDRRWQWFVFSALLSNAAIDLVTRRSTEDQARGIRWSFISSLEDLDFAEDLAFLSNTNQHMQENIQPQLLCPAVWVNINRKQRIDVITLNTPNPSPIQVDGEDLPTTEERSPTKVAPSDNMEE